MVELSLQVPRDVVDTVSDMLIDELEALSVSVEDADLDAKHMLFGEPGIPVAGFGWQCSALKALFYSEVAATDAATRLLAHIDAGSVSVKSITAVVQQDWLRLAQSQFAPLEITPNFWVVPSWHQPPAAAQRVVRLDPGLAFGTGTHPTTRMCLRWIAGQLETSVAVRRRVLDYGCGSGILAIAAAMFGAGEIDAVDIDSSAVEVTRANARANGVLVNAAGPEVARGSYSLVLANILAGPLTLLAPVLSAHVQPGGDMVLAGILAPQAGELQVAYAPWLRLEICDREDDWILMTGKRAA